MSYEYLDLLCMGCFARLESSGMVCPYCGFDEKSYNVTPYRLPLRTILGGKYMVGKVLGEGGFGITYIGYDLNLDVKVAVKEFYPSDLVTRSNTVSTTVQPYSGERSEYFAKGRDKFVDEAKRLARFRVLPGIVMVNDFLAENGTAYIVMEYVEGKTLKEYIAQTGGKLPPGQIIELMRPVFGSLAQIHESGIIHRDISPDNVMITGEGNVKLLDFGAAREFGEEDNKSLSVMLKHGYAPPEQYSTKGEQGSHTDVYALSATIYKAVTGVTPENSMDRVMEDTVVPPSRLGVNIQENQEAALMRGMAVRHQDRYQSASEFYEALYGASARSSPAVVAQENRPPVSIAQENRPPVPPHVPEPVITSPGPLSPKSFEKEKKNKIIGAVIAACVVIAVVLVLVLPGTNDGSSGNSNVNDPGETQDMNMAEAAPAPSPTPHPTPVPTPEPTPEPEPVISIHISGCNEYHQGDLSGWHDIWAIDTGFFHTLGIRENGTVVAAGMNFDGECDVSDWSDIIAISAGAAPHPMRVDGKEMRGGSHSVGVKVDGTVVATGLNEYGQCDVSGWSDIVAIATGGVHTLGLKSNGTVVAAGWNAFKQCDVSGWSDIVEVSAGAVHSVGLKSDGTVVAVGANPYSQCDVSGWRDIVTISAGFNFTAGLKSDGTLVYVGHTNHGGMENIYSWRNIVAISAGAHHIAGIREDGTAVAAGWNEHRQLNVAGWQDVIAISAGSRNTVALVLGNWEYKAYLTMQAEPVVMLGITANLDIDHEVDGAYVGSVSIGSAASLAGVLPGDSIIKLGDFKIDNFYEIDMTKGIYRVGDTTTITVLRDGEEVTMDITFRG